jgi:transcription-repair coupling factor (superfamily II helicase)
MRSASRKMDLSALLPLVDGAVELDRLRRRMSSGRPLTVGVTDGAKAAVLAALARDGAGPILVITARPHQADAIADELAAWLGDETRVLTYPERDALPYERLAPDPNDIRRRLDVLDALTDPRARCVVVAPAAAVAQRTLSPARLRSGTVEVATGRGLHLRKLLEALDSGGYVMAAQVTAPGEASRRGGIIDVWAPTDELPLRIELFGDDVESIRAFDPTTQRSAGLRELARIGPAAEALADGERMRELAAAMQPNNLRGAALERFERDIAALHEGARFDALDLYTPYLAPVTLLDHLPPDSLLVIDEPADVAAMQQERDDQANEARHDLEARGELPRGMPAPHVPWQELRDAIESRAARVSLSRWATGDIERQDGATDVVRLPFGPAAAYGGRLRALSDELTQSLRGGQQVIIVSTQARRLVELLEEHGVYARLSEAAEPQALGRSGLALIAGSLPHGWTIGEGSRGITLLTDAEVFGFTKQRRATPRRGPSREAFIANLAPGEYVVHIEHGIAKFAGLVRREAADTEREFLELHYADGDRLFVPTEQVDRVSRYVGPGEHRPSLTRLGSQEWPRAKARVRRAVQELAGELLKLYAAREVSTGHAFPPDTAWQTELEASFPYVETADQISVIRDVKQDMESQRPMDRLVCGDVGYGKTEIAVRAAFKAVMDGTQVAILVPTTVLAQQHFNTFHNRLAGFPVKVETLSRFRSDGDQRRIIGDAAGGTVDIVIGTHRLLQKDVTFKNLGLVIIDEEQRFGVAHKERLKQMRSEVDVLTLTATPIPRTLNMALTGIRDMSTIETPPEERLPIKTYVAEFDDHLVREAIVREMERGGQVYFVHNRVHNIEMVARKVRELAPGAEVLIGHGQMAEDQLERVMLEFTGGKSDVLVCTTIIESGLDIPNVNTIIVNNADRFGLAQLYQLRGRVGRGAARAYAYLLYEKHRALSEVAQRRLQAIFEATELGAGFQIALRDLEIRGAGNVLGAEQSGQIGAVGFDLYVRLLADAVQGLKALAKGEPPPASTMTAPVTIDVPLRAFIPETYIDDLNLRLSVYQRMATAEATDAAQDLERELSDRFGSPPPPVRNLLYIVRLRTLARRAAVQAISREEQHGREMLVVRGADGVDLRGRLSPEARRALERTNAVTVGHGQIRLDLEALGDTWRSALVNALEAAATVEMAA